MARVLAEYNDLCASGNEMEVSRFLERHPECSPELCADLEAFRDLRAFLDSSRPFVPEKFEDFELLSELGGGTYGIVYQARQLSLDRRVALKILQRRFLDDRKTLARFRREAKVIARFDHPNLVRVHSIRLEGNPYINMELVDGEDLKKVITTVRDVRERLQGKQVPRRRFWRWRRCEDPQEAPEIEPSEYGPVTCETLGLYLEDEGEYYRKVAGWFAGVAEGLQHAHDLGVVHRDVKPANLMLDRAGRLRVVDFGLARADGLTQASVTGDRRVGTLLYMSPEQVDEPSGQLTASTDVYSLGVTLYEMLTLRPLYPGLPQSEVADRIRSEDLPALTELNPAVPVELDGIVRKCLEKRPTERFKTAGALAAELRRFVQEPATVETLPPSQLKRWRRRMWRWRWRAVQVAGAAALLASAGLLASNHQKETYNEALKQYNGFTTPAGEVVVWEEQRRATPVVDSGRGEERPQRARGGSPARPDLWQGGLNSLFEPVPSATAVLLQSGSVLLGTQTLEEALDQLNQAVELLPGELRAHYYLARLHRLQGRQDLAAESIRTALELDPAFAPALVLRSQLDGASGEGAEPAEDWAREWLKALRFENDRDWEQAAAALERAIEGLSRDSSYEWLEAELLLRRGLALRNSSDFRLALFAFGKSSTSDRLEPVLYAGQTALLDGFPQETEKFFHGHFQKVSQVDSARARDAAIAFSAIYRDARLLEPARAWAERAHQLDRDNVRARLTVADVLMDQGSLDEAERWVGEVVALAPREVEDLVALGTCLEGLGKLETASQTLRAAIDLAPRSGKPRFLLGKVLFRRGLAQEAAESYRAAIRCGGAYAPLARNEIGILLDTSGSLEPAIDEYLLATTEAPHLAVAHFNLGWAYQRQFRYGEAVAAYERAVELGLDHAVVYNNLGPCYQFQLEYEKALAAYEEALKREPENAVTQKSLASLYMWLESRAQDLDEKHRYLEKARCHYAAASELNPTWAEPHYALGEILKRQGRAREAIAEQREAIRSDATYLLAYEHLARLLRDEPLPAEEELEAEILRFETVEFRTGLASPVRELLDRYRQAFLPRLASPASIDWIIERPEVLVPPGSVWRLQRSGVELEGLAWTGTEFDDGSWVETTLAAGDLPAAGDEEGPSPVYLRCRFQVEEPSRRTEILLAVRARSGERFRVFLNGQPAALEPENRDCKKPEEAGKSGEPVARLGPLRTRRFRLSPDLLRPGANVLAVSADDGFAEGAGIVLRAAPAAAVEVDRRAREELAAYLEVAEPVREWSKIEYARGRLSSLGGNPQLAAGCFELAAAADPGRPEPCLQLAESLRAPGDPEAAEAVLAAALGTREDDRLWDLWLRTVLVDEGLGPAAVLERWPVIPTASLERGADLRWAITALKEEGAIRINAGAITGYRTGTESWGQDRFFDHDGQTLYLVDLEPRIGELRDPAVLMTARVFYSREPVVKGYAIPLPPGAYRVTLVFVEGWESVGEKRKFDVLLEGETFLREYRPSANGFGVHEWKTKVVEVRDGILNIDFVRFPCDDDPEICAVVVEEDMKAQIKER
jgi:serine/threonine protein kinase/tetratricopeptide (TPR) repeat protein